MLVEIGIYDFLKSRRDAMLVEYDDMVSLNPVGMAYL